MSEKTLQEDVTSKFLIEKTRFEYAISPIQIDQHESIGHFVRISQSSGKNYIYIKLFFKQVIEEQKNLEEKLGMQNGNWQ